MRVTVLKNIALTMGLHDDERAIGDTKEAPHERLHMSEPKAEKGEAWRGRSDCEAPRGQERSCPIVLRKASAAGPACACGKHAAHTAQRHRGTIDVGLEWTAIMSHQSGIELGRRLTARLLNHGVDFVLIVHPELSKKEDTCNTGGQHV